MSRLSLIIAIALILPIFAGCKKKENFTDHELLLNRWCRATENLDYAMYKKSEAYPREEGVFKEMYGDFYFADIKVIELEELDEKDLQKDFEGSPFIKRNVRFECFEVNRSDKRKIRILGEVFIIKFTEGSRAYDGWLMTNRTLIRLDNF